MRILYRPHCYSQQRQFDKKRNIYPVLMAMEATKYLQFGHDVVWIGPDKGNFDKIVEEPEGLDFLSLPFPDRIFTRAMDRIYQENGNFKYHPGTYILSAIGCSWGKCSFCVENGKRYVSRDVENVISEIDKCHSQGFKEIFDDSATFPDGKWCYDFCRKMIARKYKIKMGCNLRINSNVDFRQMKEAGFRMVLFGIESINQGTLNRINKGVISDEIIPTIRKASRCGLEPHICVIFGIPGETCEEESRTLDIVIRLLREGYAKTAQASLYRVSDVVGFDRGFRRRIYRAGLFPDFWINKIKDIKNIKDFSYLLKGIRMGIFNA